MFQGELVSVIMPLYNSERYVAKAIKSVLSQTHTNLELIVIDDGSTDLSREIVSEFLDPRLTIIALAHNGGVAAARNRGIDVAKGRFLAFCDSDDFWFSEKLAVQIKLLKDTGAPLSHSDARLVDEYGTPVGNRRFPIFVTYEMERYRNFICNSSAVVDRTRCDPLKQETIYHEDYLMWLSVLKFAGNSVSPKIALLDYTINPSGLSADKMKSLRGGLAVQRLHGIGFFERCWGVLRNIVSRLLYR